ncbi:MAG: exonuclease domain-containing protein [Thermomicrobiales bacterium]
MEFRREDRDRAIAWARSVVSDSRVIYLDTETTGLDRTAEIIDIALVTNDGAVLFNTLVKPVRPIPSEIIAHSRHFR